MIKMFVDIMCLVSVRLMFDVVFVMSIVLYGNGIVRLSGDCFMWLINDF